MAVESEYLLPSNLEGMSSRREMPRSLVVLYFFPFEEKKIILRKNVAAPIQIFEEKIFILWEKKRKWQSQYR